MVRAIVVMGVSGAGKTSIGRALAVELGWAFYDGDDFHPLENLEKMAEGQPLSDLDRLPWLERLHRLIVESLDEGKSLVLACSALRKNYRRLLQGNLVDVAFVYLKGDSQLMEKRLRQRAGHFMKPGMLQSQFETLEPPDEEAIVLDASESIQLIVKKVVEALENNRD